MDYGAKVIHFYVYLCYEEHIEKLPRQRSTGLAECLAMSKAIILYGVQWDGNCLKYKSRRYPRGNQHENPKNWIGNYKSKCFLKILLFAFVRHLSSMYISEIFTSFIMHIYMYN